MLPLSSDLDIATGVTVGLRYVICVPFGTEIVSATISLTADEADSEPTTAVIQGEASPNSLPFSILLPPSSRIRTAASVDWTLAPEWVPGTVDTSPDISEILNEIVSSPFWFGCGPISIFIDGDGDREAVAWETDPAHAPHLEITFEDQ